MSEIAKCPMCGGKPRRFPITGWETGWKTDMFMCCGYGSTSVKGWNKYAAAMELAKAAVRREVSDYGSANTALSGSNAYVDKFLRVLEVFGK